MKTKVILYLLIVNSVIFSQSFTASVDNTTVGHGDRFQVYFKFEGTDINNLKNFTPPNFNNFLTLSGPNQSTSMSIINGAVTASITYSFILQPREIGTYTIGSASIDNRGSILKTEPIKITVVQGSPKKEDKKDDGVDYKEIADNVFIRAIPDKNKVLIGEQVTITYKLFTRLNIASLSISKLPSYVGFWAEEIETSNNITFATEVIDGKQFRTAVLKKAALFPTQTGELSVTPFELNVPVLIQRKRKSTNPFDDFFNDPFFNRPETVEFTAKSNTIKINVTPLPNTNVPETFKGAVGNFNFSAKIDKENAKTNEPVTLTLQINGTGNIKLLDLPEIKLPAGFEIYDPNVSEEINRSGRISGKKKAEYLIIPRIAGKREIPPIEFSFFDTQKNSYVTQTSPSFNINVEQGAVTSDNFAGTNNPVSSLGNDIRFIKTKTSLQQKNNILIDNPYFFGAAGIPLLAFLLLIAFKKREAKLSGNLEELRFRKADKVARKRLKNAKLFFDKNENLKFYDEISFALINYLEDKFHIPKADFTIENAVSKLREFNINDETVESVKTIIEKCEFVRFSPEGKTVAAMSEMYENTIKAIISIEKDLLGNRK